MNKQYPVAPFRGAALLFLVGFTVFTARGQSAVSTIAGNGAAGNVDGPALTAQFNNPQGVAVDAQGTTYVADWMNHTIRKITATGTVTTFAGSSRGYYNNPYGPFASFALPENLLLIANGNLLVADTGNGSIRQITPAGDVTTFAGTGIRGYMDGPAASARFSGPIGLAQDAAGNVCVADVGNYRIRRIDPSGNVTTLAGSGVRGFLDGPAATARFFEPQGIALDAAGNLYIADRAAQRIRKLTPAGVVSTYAGSGTAGYLDGPAATARFNSPVGVALDARGDVYVSERSGHRLRRIEAATGQVSTVAGTGTAGYADGPGLSALFDSPTGLAIQGGRLYVADAGNQRIRQVSGLPLGARIAANSNAGLQLEAFPNPFTDQFTMRFTTALSIDEALLELYSVTGTRVKTQKAPRLAQGEHLIQMSTSDLPTGIYTYRLITGGKVEVGKITK